MKLEDTYYQALLTRDYRFDGKFFVGVRTTGIYCRPICPAKPKRENLEFFKSYLEAEKAGYRPCLRCRPESAPQSAAWIGKSAVVQRAVKVLSSLETIAFNEDDFAAQFGVTARHLRRLFNDEIGKTPKQLAFEHRLNLARKLMTETSLPVSEICFSAGFTSLRRFNDAFKERFKRAPSEIRRMSAPPQESNLRILISYRPPFDFESLLRSYERHRIGDLEWFSDGRMHRIVAMNGKVGKITIANSEKQNSLVVEIDFPDTSCLHLLIARVRNMFDLNSDPIVIANSLESDPEIKKLFKKIPGLRLPSGWDPFETAIATILGQLVSLERGRSLVRDLMEIAGTDSDDLGGDFHVKLLPSPEALANADLSSLKTTRARKETLIAFSRAVHLGEISLQPTQDIDAFLARVQTIKGIGPWTAQYMALKVLRATDSFPTSDLILARAILKHPIATFQQMSPWRGYVAALFWHSYASDKKLERLSATKDLRNG